MRRMILLFLLMLLNISFALAQETVYIEANEFGRGIIKPRAAECFAIVPLHIVEGNSNIEIIGEKNAKTKGELIQATANDLAIVRTTMGAELYCEDWKVDGSYDRILENSVEGFLKIRQNDGGFKLIQVDIKEVNESNITIEPKKSNDVFSKGMSGSTLFTNVDGEKICLGMLMEIDSENNEGYIFQLDDILANLHDFFDLKTTKTGNQRSSKSSIMNSKYPVFTEDNLSIQLERCFQNGNKVNCEITLLSKEKDYDIYFYGSNEGYTKLYDELGHKFKGSFVKIANESDNKIIRINIIADTAMKGSISFDVNKKIESISKLQLVFKHYKKDRFDSVWRNVQVE